MLVTDLPQDRNARFVLIRRPLVQLANRCRHTVKLRPLLKAQLQAVLDELDKQDEVDTLADSIAEVEAQEPETGSALTKVNADEITEDVAMVVAGDPIAGLRATT